MANLAMADQNHFAMPPDMIVQVKLVTMCGDCNDL